MTRKIFKYIGILLLALLGLFLLLAFALTIPKVQTSVTHQVTKSLSETLNAKVQIKEVDIEFFKTTVLKGIYIEDEKKDTLIYADRLAADIGLFSLLQRNIFLNSVTLKGAKINLARTTADSTFNFEFILKLFQANPDKVVTNKAPWTFGIGAVAIENANISYWDEWTRNAIQTKIPNLAITANKLDLQQQVIDLQQVKLDEAVVDYQVLAGEKMVDTTTIVSDLTFPELGWDLTLDQLELLNNQVNFNNIKLPEKAKAGIDFQHLEIANLFLTIEDFAWIDKSIVGAINRFSLTDKSGFELDNLTGQLLADTTQIVIENLAIKTPLSQVANTTKLQFKQFADLTDLANKVNFESDFNNASIAFQDLKLFAPAINKIQQLDTDLQEQLFLDGHIKGNAKNLIINNLNFSIGEQVDLSLNGQLQNITDVNQATFDVQLKKLTTSYQKVNRLLGNLAVPKGLEEFGQFTLSGAAKGQLNDFNINDLFFLFASNTNLRGVAYLVGLPTTGNWRFDLEITALEARAEEWKVFLKDSIAPVLCSLCNIQCGGK
ncbi:MAG: hypothetical protein AB8G86_23155, partial [Saprospiraceae bacterium]